MKESYAVAMVVGRRAPVSSHLGDRALIHANGRMEGFIGGACSRDIIRRQALMAIRTGEPRLVRIRPDALEITQTRDAVTVPMTCISEGAVDVYIEPHIPKRVLLIAGFAPVADALAQIAPALDFEVVRFVNRQELRDFETTETTAVLAIDDLDEYLRTLQSELPQRCVGIAASQGHYDERALTAFLNRGIGFIGLFASVKRGLTIVESLVQAGISAERAATVHHPVGLAIGARRPAEVAISILAEIIAAEPAPLDEAGAAAQEDGSTASDPVCGMLVEISSAEYHADAGGSRHYFCSSHCRESFASS